MYDRDWYRDSVKRRRDADKGASFRGAGKPGNWASNATKGPVTLKQAFVIFCWVMFGLFLLAKWYPSSSVAYAPNGEPWPKTASYLKGYPVLKNEGGSRIQIDNSTGVSAVHGQLLDVLTDPRTIVRQFYIPAGEVFEMRDVSPGGYKLRFMEVASGNAWEVDSVYTVGIKRYGNSYQHTGFSLRLNRMRNENSVKRTSVKSSVFRGG